MKILLVIHDFWPNYMAGTENATYFLAKELAKKHEVTVFTTEPNSPKAGFHEEYHEEGFNVIKIHRASVVPKNLRDTYINEQLDLIFEQYLKKLNPDVVHFQHLIGLSLNFIAIAKKANVKIIYTLHDFWFQCPRIRRYYKEKNCLMNDEKRCNNCIRNNFLFFSSGNENSSFFRALNTLLRTRYLKRITHILLNNFRLKYFLNRNSGTNLIQERDNDFLKYFQNVDVFISPSKFLANEAVKFGIKREQMLVIAHGIDIPKKWQSFEKRKKMDKIIHFCFMSHITKDKGFILMAENFLKLSKKHDDVRLSIYGAYDENNNKEVARAMSSLKKEANSKYLGVFNRNNLHKILADVDVLVVPSLWQEIYGLIIDEAFLYGIPVIVSDRGGMSERVSDKINGFIFNPDEKYDLYEKMLLFVKNPEIINTMSREAMKPKTIEMYAFEIETIYNKVLLQK